MLGSLGWRIQLLGEKAAGRRPMVPWSAIWNSVRLTWDYTFPIPEFTVVDRDPGRSLNCVAAGEHTYWIPSTADNWGLGSMYKEVFNPKQTHYYEFEGCRIEPDDVVIDGGACEGFFTRYALSRGARVIVVEPWSVMCEALGRTYATEIAAGRVVIERGLISDQSGQSTLVFHPEWPFGAHQAHGPVGEGQTEPVPELTIDEIVARSPWKRCDFIKLDIEGAEPRAIVGAEQTLRRFSPDLAIAIYHRPSDYQTIQNTLRNFDLGYRTSAKGVLTLPEDEVWRAQILHAWQPERGSAAG